MGQRSQIYIKYDGKIKIATYYQWNYGYLLVDTARNGIEYLANNADCFRALFSSGSEIKKIRDNFNVLHSESEALGYLDILKEYERDREWLKKRKNFVYNDWLFGQDNNDGALFIDIEKNKKRKEEDEDTYIMKYAFTDYTFEKPMDAIEYIKPYIENLKECMLDGKDKEEVGTWQKRMIYTKKITDKNHKYISKHATLMTQKEFKDFMEVEEPKLQDAEKMFMFVYDEKKQEMRRMLLDDFVNTYFGQNRKKGNAQWDKFKKKLETEYESWGDTKYCVAKNNEKKIFLIYGINLNVIIANDILEVLYKKTSFALKTDGVIHIYKEEKRKEMIKILENDGTTYQNEINDLKAKKRQCGWD